MKILVILLIIGAFVLGWTLRAEAADPLDVVLQEAQAYRHVLETGDWLVLGRLYLTPDSSTGNTDSFSVSTTGGDFDDPVVVSNKVVETTDADFIVTETGVPTVLTSFCTLGQDDQTIDCEGTGLANNTYTVEVEYRMGWDAYSETDVFVRLTDTGTPVAETRSPAGTYTLTGLYLTASDVSTLALTWGDANILLNALGSPNLWDTPADVDAVIDWNATADMDATETTLQADLLAYLTALELDDPAVSSGDYVTPNGITTTGAVVAARAFSRIQDVVPNAFLSFEVNQFPDAVSTPTASVVVDIEAAVASTTVFALVQDIHPAAGGFFTFLASVILAGGLWMGTKSLPVAGGGWFVAITGGWLLFAIPFQLVFIPAAAIVAIAFVWVAKMVYD